MLFRIATTVIGLALAMSSFAQVSPLVPTTPQLIDIGEYTKAVTSDGKPISFEDFEVRELEKNSIKAAFLVSIAKSVNEIKLANIQVSQAAADAAAPKPAQASMPTNDFQFGPGMNFGGGVHAVQQKSQDSSPRKVVTVRDINSGVAYITIDGRSFAARSGFEDQGVKVVSVAPDRIKINDNGSERFVHLATFNVREIPVVRQLVGGQHE